MLLNGLSSCACVCVLVLVYVFGVGECLDCYKCNVTGSATLMEDPCKGLATLQKCQDPAVCLAAIYSYEDSSLPETTTTFKTCYPNLRGKECEMFLQNIRTINPTTANIHFSKSCVTCSEDGCNHEAGKTSPPVTSSKTSAASTLSTSSIVSLLVMTAVMFS